ESIVPALRFVFQEAGLELDVHLAPYNQIFQELLSPTSLLGTNTGGVNVILVRVEDFVRAAKHLEEALAIIERIAAELANALSHYAKHAKVATVLAVLPPSPRKDAGLLPQLDTATEALLKHARALPGVTLLSSDEIELVSPE